MSIKAVLLDLDGTVLNTIDDLADSVNHAMTSLAFPARTVDEVRTICGNGPRDLIRRCLPEIATDSEFEECLARFKAHYETNKTNKTAPYDGIIDALKDLKANGYKVALVSNKHDDALRELTKYYFGDIIDFSTGSSDIIPKKPAPDMVRIALRELNATEAEAVFVGDSEVDVQTAKNASLPCIAVTWGFRTKDILTNAGATNFIDSASELLGAVKAL